MDENNEFNATPAEPADPMQVNSPLAAPAEDLSSAQPVDAASAAEKAADAALEQASAAAEKTAAAASVPVSFDSYTAPQPMPGYTAPAQANGSYTAPQPVPGYTAPANPYGTPAQGSGAYTAPQPGAGYNAPNPYGTPMQPNGTYNASQPVPGYGMPMGRPGMAQPAGGLATASLVLGIVSLVFCLFGEGAIVSVICGIVGMVLASNAKKAGNTSSMRSAGFIMSLIGVIGGALVFVACAAFMGLISAASYF